MSAMLSGAVMSLNGLALIGLALAVSSTAVAQNSPLESLGVVGPVVKAEPFYTHLIRKSLPKFEAKLSTPDSNRIKRWTGFVRYDSGLRRASFEPRAFTNEQAKYLVTPICLIANDAESVTWLKRVHAVLKEKNAVCYLVRADSDTDDSALQNIISDVPFIALNPRIVIEQFNVPGYPALISDQGIEQ